MGDESKDYRDGTLDDFYPETISVLKDLKRPTR